MTMSEISQMFLLYNYVQVEQCNTVDSQGQDNFYSCNKNMFKKVSEHDQAHTTEQPMAPLGRAKEWQQRHEIQNTTKVKQPDPGYKTFFILNSAEHEIYPTHKC